MPQILDHLGRPLTVAKPATRPRRPRVRGSYDVAQTTDENRKHWQAADSLSANAANDRTTRETVRDRARYEVANNPYAAGLIEQLSDDTIGTGPRLQLKIPGVARQAASKVETDFRRWAEQIHFAEKLRVAHKAKIRDGEAFILHFSNPALDPFLPQLDLKLYECDQIADPYEWQFDPQHVDGIVFDEWGNPSEYHLLKFHPGAEYAYFNQEYETIEAARIVHWFRPDRPGQARGIPEIMPALPLFAQMRRMTSAVLTAAEFAACISGVLYSDQAGEYQGSDAANGDDPAFDRIEIERGALLTAPRGYKAAGFDPTQPFEGFGEFRGELLNEMGRSTQTPGILVSGDYSQVNYSSGRLARLPYQHSIKVRRHDCRIRCLRRTLLAWLYEYGLMGNLDGLPPIADWSIEWQWDGFASVDPQKEATARVTLLQAGLTTFAREFAEDGRDWEEEFEQQGIEQGRRNDMGLSVAQALGVPMETTTTTTDENGEETSETSRQAAATGGVQGTALNGAQIASLMALADKVALKQYPADAAESILQAAFPLMSKALISKFVQSLSKYTPPPLPAPAQAPAAPAADPVAASGIRESIEAMRDDLAHYDERSTERKQIADKLSAIEAQVAAPLNIELPTNDPPAPPRRTIRVTRADNGAAREAVLQ